MVLVAPSILAADPSNLGEAVRIADKAGADWIHLDIMDGHFVPNFTYGPPVVRALRPQSKLPFDAHLMVSNPDDLVPEFLDIGVEYISVHQETCTHLHRTLSRIREGGSRSGLALNPATPVETVIDALPVLDLIVVMAVNPGFYGQKHIPETAEKVARLAEMVRERDWEGLIQVDGGVDTANIGHLVLAGTDVVVAGASGFRKRKRSEPGADKDFTEQVRLNIEDLRTACKVAIEQGVDL